MIKFNIQKDDLKYIFNALKAAVAKVDCKRVQQYIKFECKDSALTACAVDGYRIHSVTVNIDVEGEKKDFAFLLKPFTLPKCESSYVPCELSEREIMFNFGERKFIEKLGTDIDCFLDVNKAIPSTPSVFKIGFNVQYLVEAAKSLQTKNSLRNPIVMEFFGALNPAILYNDCNKSDFRVILPVRLRSDNNA